MRRRSLLVGMGSLGLGLSLARVGAAAAAEPPRVLPVVYGYLAAWNAHNVARASRYFAEDVVYYDATVGTRVDGKQAATTGVVANFINAVPDLIWGIRGPPSVTGNEVAFSWSFTGTNTGAWADGRPATNRRFTFTGISVFRIRDGLIVEQSDYYDVQGLFRQLGWS
jgi:steroid delta-isomerase-like uncharacterized protein